jgi:hypothetical protein
VSLQNTTITTEYHDTAISTGVTAEPITTEHHDIPISTDFTAEHQIQLSQPVSMQTITIQPSKVKLVKVKRAVFWNLTPCSLVGDYQRFVETLNFHAQ